MGTLEENMKIDEQIAKENYASAKFIGAFHGISYHLVSRALTVANHNYIFDSNKRKLWEIKGSAHVITEYIENNKIDTYRKEKQTLQFPSKEEFAKIAEEMRRERASFWG